MTKQAALHEPGLKSGPRGTRTMNAQDNDDAEQAATYDDAAKKIEWVGPSLVFDLLSPYIRPGQAVLDIGIGTGLGSEPLHRAGLQVTGIDLSRNMLAACNKKGIATRLIHHDLTAIPYPFDDSSFDVVISTGVFQFFADLSLVFGEIARLLTGKGMFAFIVGDRDPEEAGEIIAGPEQTGTSTSVTMYRLTPEQVTGWLEMNGLRIVDSVPFTVWMDENQTRQLPARAYLAQRLGAQNKN